MIKWFKRKEKASSEPEAESLPQESSSPDFQEDIGSVLEETPSREPPDGDITPADPPQHGEWEPVEGGNALAEEDLVESGGEEEEEKKKGRFFRRLRERLHKTREQFANRVDRLVHGKKTIDLDLLDELEEILITSDLGVRTTQVLLQKVTEKIKRQELKDPQRLHEQLREEIKAILSVPAPPWDIEGNRPYIVMIIGVNGVGKTTTIGKLGHTLKQQGLKVLLVAGDTFRAAAIEQLSLWGERVDVPVIRQKTGSDPSAVVFDALDAAVSRDADVVLLDTAGRMHTKVNLMEELKKVHRVVSKKIPNAPHEILLVLDATTGQNALSQAKLFKEAIGITGLILTKLDGTAKGGIIVAICEELQVPVRYIGIGESLEDLRPFDPEEFCKALF